MKVIFICCFHVNSFKKLHDFILTDQRGVFRKLTTQYDTEPKIDSNNFRRKKPMLPLQ